MVDAPQVDVHAQTLELDRAHVLHGWSQAAIDAPFVIIEASGPRFTDDKGREYLDFVSQQVNVNLGHQHPRLVRAISEQAKRLCVVAPGLANDARSEAAKMLSDRAPADLNTVFFTNGGAEAIENAIRMARLHTGRPKIFSAYRSYHGGTAGALTVSGDARRLLSEPGIPSVVRFMGPYLYRSSFHSTTESEECDRALGHLREILALEGPESVAGILLEPIVGTNGILVPPAGYLAGVRKICDEFGILMIADEVMSGFGRVGHWFAVDHWKVCPDLITFAKGVNSGALPLGGVLLSDAIRATFEKRPFPGGLTYQGHPLGCASAVSAMHIYEEERVLPHAQRMGAEVIGPKLRSMLGRHASVGEVRGLGMFWAIELVRDRDSREPLSDSTHGAHAIADVASSCKRNGLWPFVAGNRLHVSPPCNTSESDLEEGLAIIDDALSIADRCSVSA